MESSSSASKRRPPLPFIRCPFCDAKIITAVCGPRGSKPDHWYYKCCLKDAGKCQFYEWQEGYEVYLLAGQDAEVTDENQAPVRSLATLAPAADNSFGARAVQDLMRVDIMLGVTNLIATVLLL